MLENMLIANAPSIGSCRKALSGLVLHYSEGGAGARPCEAAWLGCSQASTVCSPSVRVYVSKSSLATMKQVYAPLGDKVSVRSLRFSQSELDAQAILSMMAVGSSESAPLYMHSILVRPRHVESTTSVTHVLRPVDLARIGREFHLQRVPLPNRASKEKYESTTERQPGPTIVAAGIIR